MWTALFGSLALGATPVAEDSVIDRKTKAPVALRLRAEVGALATLKHDLQVGNEGDFLSVPGDLGQNVLYPFLRFQADLDIGKKFRRNTLVFLYQPLTLNSTLAPERDFRVGDLTFPEGRGMDFSYGFSFWRMTWMYDVVNALDTEIAFGLGLQIRNANIVFESLDGSGVVASRNIGPVPLLAFRGRGTLTKRLWMAGEAQGFYAPIRGLNGGTVDVEGAIADISMSLGLSGPKGADAFLTLRYVGGGAVGASSSPDPFTDGFTRNWLHLMSLSLGFGLR